ncbi:MAG: hypothetical protein JJU02_14450 [Cryomorphaceae bacterium]|nr:hypothetical protein [Cryomorphaceae bacterium]
MLARLFSGVKVIHPFALAVMTIALLIWNLVWIPGEVHELYFWGKSLFLNAWAGAITGVAMAVFASLIFHHTAKAFQFSKNHYLIPPVMLMVVMCFYGEPFFLNLTQSLFFFSILFTLFMRAKERRHVNFAVFDLGLLLGVMILFHGSYIFIFPLICIGFAIFGFQILRSIVVLFLGLAVTIFLKATIVRLLVLGGNRESNWVYQFSLGESEGLLFSSEFVFVFIVLGVLLFAVLPEITRSATRSSVAKRRWVSWGLISILASMVGMMFWQLSFVLLSIFVCYSVMFLSNKMAYATNRWKNVWFYALFIVILMLPLLR